MICQMICLFIRKRREAKGQRVPIEVGFITKYIFNLQNKKTSKQTKPAAEPPSNTKQITIRSPLRLWWALRQRPPSMSL